MALESEDPRAFVLAALKDRSKGKKRAVDAPSTSTFKKVSTKPATKKQKFAAKKARDVTPDKEPDVEIGVKRLRQDALEWKLLSAQPEDFGDDFGDDIDHASDADNQETKKGARKSKADPMANLFDNEGGMMMLEEVDGVDVMWEEDGKGGKKAILVVSGSRKRRLRTRRNSYPCNRKPRQSAQSKCQLQQTRRLFPHQASPQTTSPRTRSASDQKSKVKPFQKRFRPMMQQSRTSQT